MARKRYKTTIVRRLRQLGACVSGLQYVAGKTVDQAWENCNSPSFYIWWIQMVWKQWPERRAHYFDHPGYTLITAQALDPSVGTRRPAERALHSAVHEAPTFLRRAFRLTAKRWAKDQGLRVVRKAWKALCWRPGCVRSGGWRCSPCRWGGWRSTGSCWCGFSDRGAGRAGESDGGAMGARLIWAGENYRIVKRDTSRWREGVFDIEHRSTDALGHDSWSQVECVSYDNKDAKHAALVEIIRFTLDK